MKIIRLLTLVLFFTTPVHAAEAQPRLITVAGEGEVYAVPDEVAVNFQVEIFDENLDNAKKANDEAVKGAFEVVKKYGVEDKDFRTDYFTVRNEERWYQDPQTNQQRSRKGFYVTKNVSVTLRDVAKFEDLYSDALKAGVNNINGVEFKTSAVKKYRDEARALAVRAAKEKAAQIAKELGEEVGRPYAIQESAQTDWPGPRPMMAMAMLKTADSAANNETIALGQIKISSSVTASFEMK